jgi:hypothetical protein
MGIIAIFFKSGLLLQRLFSVPALAAKLIRYAPEYNSAASGPCPAWMRGGSGGDG